METVSFHQLNTMDVSLYNLASIKPMWRAVYFDKYIDVGRGENLLFYMIHGERIYSLEDRDFLSIRDGDILFAPSGCHYVSRVHLKGSEDYSTGICIKFDIKDERGNEIILEDQPQMIAHDIDGQYLKAFIKLHDIIMQGTGEKLYSKALLLQLLDGLITSARKNKSFSSSLKAIYPAIVKIEQSPQEPIYIANLAEQCFLSESTFRRKFRQYSGTSPANYRNSIRVRKAVELLESGIYTIEEAADALGFTDQAHLSNMVKRFTGKTPKEYVNREHFVPMKGVLKTES